MTDFSIASIKTLLAPEGHPCACGKRHRTQLRDLRVGPGVLTQLPDMLAAIHATRPFVVCDANTYRVAGERVAALLTQAGISHRLFIFPDQQDKLEPDEHAVGSLAMAFDPACDLILAVGSGVINDCCKVLAHGVGKPSMVVATAPSMDGYASNSSSMIQDSVKVTLYNRCPVAILADTDILRQAPMHMLHAGLGDMLAKYVSVCEWRIAHLVTGEYYCENVAGLMRSALSKIVAAADGLMAREPAAVEAVILGLVLSGISMSFAEVSRPASGLEHYFSHLWEMMALARGEASALHGIQVGVGTALTLPILWRLRGMTPSSAEALAAMAAFSPSAWEAEMHEIFGRIAPAIIHQEQTAFHKNDPTRHAQRLERLLGQWETICAIIESELPPVEDVLGLMRRVGMPTTPGELGISFQETAWAMIGSREIRDKYLTSSMLWDLGLLHAFVPLLSQ